ncbi:APC family permease [Lichenihabitans psoromatis]|uniref:APC family permease n=1 Tax=Lichenihabitans psoromatis TaxID=2528642 RepID=UPI0010356A86|nr:APC family permease [Lichenihabitans psoromatis]
MARVDKDKLNLAEVSAIGIGGMIGGGIFAVLGLAIATAGHAVVLTLAGGGVIALLTGLSYAHLGLHFRGDGGSFTYIDKAFASPLVAGCAGWLLVVGYVGTLALYATAFGDYGATLFGLGGARPATAVLAGLVLVGFLGINLRGARTSGSVELGVVAIKLLILAVFAAAGFIGIKTAHFVPLFDRGIASPLVAVALIFVAYEGFELIPNAIDEMADPEHNLRRAIVIAIVLTTIIYIVVAVAALGNLTPAQIQQDQEYVLAVAARPTLGEAGFVLIGIAALLSTASAINATLFGAARLAMVMAEEHALPQVFALQERIRPVPYVSLLALTVLSLAFALLVPLPAISGFASATFLVIFAAVNFSALRLSGRIGLSPSIPLAGGLLATASLGLLLWHDWQVDRMSLYLLLAVYGSVVAIQIVLTVRRGRLPPGGLTPLART